MSDQESRERRSSKLCTGRKKRRARFENKEHARPGPGPEARYRRREKWADDYEGEDPHDEEYFLEKELNFHE